MGKTELEQYKSDSKRLLSNQRKNGGTSVMGI